MTQPLNVTCLLACLILIAATNAGMAASHSSLAAAAAQARQAALDADAIDLAPDLLDDGETALGKARQLQEKGSTAKAEEKMADAQRLFREAELIAIQNSILAEAREALAEARKLRAKKYAPRTLARAGTLAQEVLATLDQDRYNTDEAMALADSAAATARLATHISTRARQKPLAEDLLLDHAADIWKLQEAARLPSLADQQTDAATAALVAEIIRIREQQQQTATELEESRQFSAALEDEIRLLDQRLGGVSEERRELVMRLEGQARVREQLTQAKSLFSASEAEVFQQSDLIVIRMTGLAFASGSADLQPGSDPLFSKISNLLSIYPGAEITVEGHTDSKGSDRLNLRLSQNRAQSVMQRLIRDNTLAPEKLSAIGYGESRPIANNETAAGRAQNRRIDLLIKPSRR
jgi:outer membrane protein OmpA-like peptidoglycan-associated protein